MSFILSWVLLWATTFPIMYVDQRLRDSEAAKNDVPDLRDKSFGVYYLLAFLSGMLILPIYFYVTRGKKVGLLIGLGWAVVAGVVALILRLTLFAVLGLTIE
jgi:hypothetical protein